MGLPSSLAPGEMEGARKIQEDCYGNTEDEDCDTDLSTCQLPTVSDMMQSGADHLLQYST